MKTALLLALFLVSPNLFAAKLDYALTPQKITDDIYFFEGANEDFTFKNGGNILNTGFIITDE